jgi:hypothetical protein
MGVLFDYRGIDPADDMTVRAAINQIDAAMSSVTQHERRKAPSCRVPSRLRRPSGAVIGAAIVTGFHAVASRASRTGRANGRPRRVDCGADRAHHARVLAHRR